jgi:chromosome segregation ATPase
MARAREEQDVRSTLGSLQEMIADGSQALIEGAQAVQRIVLATGRGVEGQLSTLLGTIESAVSEQLDGVLSRFSASLKTEVDRVTQQVRAIEERLGDAPSLEEAVEDLAEELLEPLRTLANGADERARSSLARVSETLERLDRMEQRVAALPTDPGASGSDVERRATSVAADLAELRRDVGGKLAELGTLRERFTRIENRVLETSKEQIARAGEATGMRDRLARLEARLTDLSREQVARAVESAGLRERVFRLEQRAGALSTTSGGTYEGREAPAED